MTDQKRKIPWIPIILSIFYFALVGIAINLNITKSNFAFGCCVKLSIVATVIAIIALFTIEKKDSDEKHKQKIAGFVLMHLILWGAMFFLPFGDYPKISLAALILFAINEAALTASLSGEEKAKKSKEGMTAVAENAIKTAIFLIVLIVILHFVKVMGAERKFSNFFNSFKTEISGNSKSDNSPVIIDDGGYMPEDERAGSMIATVKGYISPFDFKTNTPFMSTAEGTIDLSITTNAAVNVTIYFKHSGDIILDNGTVQVADESGGKITGTWNQPKSGLSGSYLMDVSDQFAIVDLEYNGQNITTIELVSN